MKILFIPTINPGPQGDLLEMTILRGLREVMGQDCVDYPRKKIMYHDFSQSPRERLHGRGFSLLYTPIPDLEPGVRESIFQSSFDAVIYGDGHIYGERVRIPEIDRLANGNSWIIDGHDLYGGAPIKVMHEGEEVIGCQFNKSFKRELLTLPDEERKIYPTGFGVPLERILDIDLGAKSQLYQKTAPDYAAFRQISDLGGGFSHHKFTEESEYYEDLSKSWFGLTCKKGGWDTLRHYEIIAAGTVLLFRDLDKKPKYCSPQGIPAPSYSSPEDLKRIVEELLPGGKPGDAYLNLLEEQRKWLLENGTTRARANYIIKVIRDEKNTRH